MAFAEGGVSYTPLYHQQFPSDLEKIAKNLQSRIERKISRELVYNPQVFGRPLAHKLSGFWKLRIGSYRLIFRIVEREIWILGIFHRRDAYKQIGKRLLWVPRRAR